jgi:hypothetical protein
MATGTQLDPRGTQIGEWPICAPELAGADPPESATFHAAAIAYLFGRDPQPGGPAIADSDRALCRRRFPGLMAAFERAHGRLRRSYFARHAFAAAAVTDRDELQLVWGREESLRSPHYVRLLFRCEQLSYAAWHRLHEYDRRQCLNMISSVAVEVMRRLDSPATEAGGLPGNGKGPARSSKDESNEVAFLENELDEAEDFMLRSATRRAQIHYTKGMLWGTLAVALLTGAAGLLLWVFEVPSPTPSHLLLVMAAGAVGALVSVLVRMTLGQSSMNLPTLDHDMKRTDLRLIGAMRPLIGAVFGLVTYALIRSALVPLDPPSGGVDLYLYVSVAFLAGFSERAAQDMFVRSGQGLVGPIGEAPATGPSAGLSPPPGRPRAA